MFAMLGPTSWAALCALVLQAQGAAPPPTPASAAALAAADVAKLPTADRKHVRYLSLYHQGDKKALAEWSAVLAFWVNSLSREAELTAPTQVQPGLWRIDLRDYQMPRAVWEKLEPAYFTARIKVKKRVFVSAAAGWKSVTKEETAAAPWSGAADSARLIRLTQSRAPIVRADWFLAWTSQQADRGNAGYYDFLAVSNLKQFQAMVGLDVKLAERMQKETRAIVARSGVTINNRQFVRYATLTGAYWASLDVERQTGRRNALRNLNGDYTADATEVFANLPNGLWALF